MNSYAWKKKTAKTLIKNIKIMKIRPVDFISFLLVKLSRSTKLHWYIRSAAAVGMFFFDLGLGMPHTAKLLIDPFHSGLTLM